MRKDQKKKEEGARGVCDKNSQISWDLIGRLLSQTHTS